MSAAIAKIANYMRLSETLAGSTLLAFSNGASDVITAVIAPEGDDDNRIIGSLFGASIFTMLIATGVIILSSKNSTVTNLQNIRIPTLFTTYLLTISYLLILASFNLGYRYFCFVLIGIYVVYIIVLEWQEQRIKLKTISILSSQLLVLENVPEPLAEDNIKAKSVLEQQIEDLKKKPRKNSGSFNQDMRAQSIANLPDDAAPYQVLMAKVNSHVHETWSERSIPLKILYPFELVLHFLVRATIPPVDEPMFFRFQQYIYPFTSVFFFLLANNKLGSSVSMGKLEIPYPLIGLAISGVLTVITILLSIHSYKATPRWLFISITSVTAIVWMNYMVSVINDIVNFVQVWTNASDTYLGMTFFGIGNSIIDLFVDFTLAKKGYQIMAITGVFGGQLFNLLIGYGLSSMVRGFQDKTLSYHLFNWGEIAHDKDSTAIIILMLTCASVLIGYWMIMLVGRFTFTKTVGIVAIGFYCAFLITMTIIEIFWN